MLSVMSHEAASGVWVTAFLHLNDASVHLILSLDRYLTLSNVI